MNHNKNDTVENAGLFLLACYLFLCNLIQNIDVLIVLFIVLEITLKCIVKDLILVIPFIIERLGFHSASFSCIGRVSAYSVGH